MHQIQVQVLELQVTEGFIQTQRDVLSSMMSAPQLHKSKWRFFISLPTEVRQLQYVQLLHKNGSRRHQMSTNVYATTAFEALLNMFVLCVVSSNIRLFYSLWSIRLQQLQKIDFTQTHLTHDKHVLTSNDALLHFGMDRLPQLHFILITVGRVQVTVTSSYSCLSCTLTQFWACVLLIIS